MKTLTKQQIRDIAFGFGCTTSYNGKAKEMHIYGENVVACLAHIREQNFNYGGIIITGKKKKEVVEHE